jgi:hypothetical protein
MSRLPSRYIISLPTINLNRITSPLITHSLIAPLRPSTISLLTTRGRLSKSHPGLISISRSL